MLPDATQKKGLALREILDAATKLKNAYDLLPDGPPKAALKVSVEKLRESFTALKAELKQEVDAT